MRNQPLHIPRPAVARDEVDQLRADLAAAHREIYRLKEYVKVCDKALLRYREATSESREQA